MEPNFIKKWTLIVEMVSNDDKGPSIIVKPIMTLTSVQGYLTVL